MLRVKVSHSSAHPRRPSHVSAPMTQSEHNLSRQRRSFSISSRCSSSAYCARSKHLIPVIHPFCHKLPGQGNERPDTEKINRLLSEQTTPSSLCFQRHLCRFIQQAKDGTAQRFQWGTLRMQQFQARLCPPSPFPVSSSGVFSSARDPLPDSIKVFRGPRLRFQWHDWTPQEILCSTEIESGACQLRHQCEHQRIDSERSMTRRLRVHCAVSWSES